MARKKQDVKEEEIPSVPQVEDVKEAQVESSQPTTEEVEVPVQPEPATDVPTSQEELDESGVPYKNRYFEWKRKAEDLSDRLPSLVEEAIGKAMSQREPKEQQYTVAQLEAFAQQNPEHRGWVEEEKMKLLRKQLSQDMEERINTDRRKQQDDIRRQQSLNYVMQNYPDAFQRDAQGNPVGWNNNSPLTREVARLMQDKRFSNDPEGLVAASDIAWARLQRMQQPQVTAQQAQAKAQVKNLQKKTLVEGGSPQAVDSVPAHQAAIERLKQTGSIKDAEEAVKAIFKSRFEATD